MNTTLSYNISGKLCLLLSLWLFAVPDPCLAQDQSAKLRVGDIIHVNVVGETITGDYEISADGSFQMPYLDEKVPAKDKTTAALQETLMTMLKPDYLLDPQIIVTLLDKKMHSCSVLGQVAQPRLIQFDPDGGLTLQEAIGQAGDVTSSGDLEGIEITRYGKTIPAPMPKSKNLRLVKGDTINVPSLAALATYSLSGFVKKPGLHTIPRGKRFSLKEAIVQGGGALDTGSLKRVELWRDGRSREIDSEEALEKEFIWPGDLLKIPRKRF